MSSETSIDNLIVVGRIVRAHGLQGEVKVQPETDDVMYLAQLQRVFTGPSASQVTERVIQSARIQTTGRGKIVLFQFEGVSSRTESEMLEKQVVFVTTDKLRPLDEDEYFVHDIVGTAVYLEGGEPLGRVVDVMDLPAQQVLVVGRPEGTDVLIPVAPTFVTELEPGDRIVVRLIDGLID